MTHTIQVAKGLEVTVNIFSDCVISSVNYFGSIRQYSYNSIDELIANTTFPSVAAFFQA